MAAGNFTMYDSAMLEIADGSQDWITDNHYCVLLVSGYTPNGATHTTFADISANEVTDTDYTAQDMIGEAVDEPSAGTIRLDATDVSFGASVTITAKYAAVVVGTVAGKTGTDPLVGYVDLDTGGGSVSSTNGAFDIQWNTNGLVQITQV